MPDYPFIIKQLVVTDFKTKYNSSLLGYMWSLLNPLIQYVVLLFVFTYAFHSNIEHYNIYLIVGIFMYSFFAECSQNAMAALVNKKTILENLKIHYHLIIFSSSLTALITFLLNFLVIIIFLLVCDIPIGSNLIRFLSVLPVLYLLALSIGLLLAKLYVRFRDLEHLYENLLAIGFWATPVVYSHEVVPKDFLFLYFLNPVTRILVYSRDVLLLNTPPPQMAMGPTCFGVLLFFLVSLFVYRISVKKLTDYL